MKRVVRSAHLWSRTREAFSLLLRLRKPPLQGAFGVVANGYREAIRAAVLAIPGVTSCRFRDDDGVLPPHSFELLVEGGDGERIAEAIFLEKPDGVATFGSFSVLITAAHVIRFSRPPPPVRSGWWTRVVAWFLVHGWVVVLLHLLTVVTALGVLALSGWAFGR